MKICVFGAGAVGGHLAVRLARAGHQVSIVARGEHLAAIRANGLDLLVGDDRINARVRAEADASVLGEQEAVLVTLKSTALAAAAGAITPLLGRETSVVFAQNGIPWWYAVDAPTAPDLSWMDPEGRLSALRPRVIGGVIHSANEAVAPGVVRSNSPGFNRLLIGEVDDAPTPRVADLRGVFEEAGVRSPVVPAIRAAVWSKLVVNISSSLLAAVAGASTGELRADTTFEVLFRRLHAEATDIATAYVADFQTPPIGPARIGHTPSILQDYERRRPMELDGLVTAPLQFARTAGIATPTFDLLATLLVKKARQAGLPGPAHALAVGV